MIIQQRINNYNNDYIENSNYIETNDNYYNNNNYNNYLITNQNQALSQEQENDEAFLDSIILSYKKIKKSSIFKI